MRRLGLMLALLVVTCAPGSRPVADLFFTNFSEFTAHLWDWAAGTPGDPHWPYGGYYNATGFVGPDVLYRAEGGDIVENTGKGGSKNALWFDSSASPDYEPSASGFSFQLTGDAHSPALVPAGYAAGATVSFSLKYDTSAFAETEYYGFADSILLMKVQSGSGYHIDLRLIDDPGGGSNDWTLWLSWEHWEGATTPSNHSVSVHIGSKTNLLDGLWHDFVIRYKPSTIPLDEWDPYPGTNGVHEAADGYIVVTDNGATIFNEQNVKLTINGYGLGENGANPKVFENVGRPEWIVVGSGMPGPYDSIAFGPLAGTWVDVANFKREWIDASRFPGGMARCLCMLWATATGVNVQARLVSLLADGVTVDAVVGTSADITAVVPTDATFAVVLTGVKRHKLQLTSATPLTGLWCAPGAKVTP